MGKISYAVKNKVITPNLIYRDIYITKQTKTGKLKTINKDEFIHSIGKVTGVFEDKLNTFQTSVNAMTIQGDRSFMSYVPYNKDFKAKLIDQSYEKYIDYLQSKIKETTKFTKAYSITVRISYSNPDRKIIKEKKKSKSKPKKKGKK
ncbi:MAG: hypothetical protein GY739_11560 [Mesoflavibacter sp.]|nr:hypothetical protein [Mesoflavibacter sp.]